MSKRVKSTKRAGRKVEKKTLSPQPNEISKDLDAIFRSRWHGAVNIRGIRYQILYSLFRAFDLYNEENETASLRLEGIEDVDFLGIRGFHYENEYVQVKSADKDWNWSQLKGPLDGFLSVHRTDANCGFVLAVGFSLTGDIEKLTRLESLLANERKRVENKFCKLCAQVGYSEAESNALLRKLTILSVPEEKIWQELQVIVAERFSLGSEAVETYIYTLVAKFLEWAKDRKTVTRLDLEDVRGVVGEALARETEFQAYGQGLINRVEWKIDATPTDFFDAKGTRSGHVVAGLDIVRPIWLEKIDVALNASKICILRSSSGQGKSTLLYRYAYEKRSPEHVFVLRIAETSEQVELIRNYLQFRANLGLPILLLIDDVRWQTRLWASVAQQCAALNIRVLVTVRDEDWQRFAQESLINYEILEPRLDLEEAKQIFQQLKTQRKVHTSAISPEWAYEKIGKPYLLMEYVYLVTQGRMLEDRLREQVRQIFQQQEDPAKIEILRRTSLAHALGTPVLVDKLLQNISFNSDPQQTLNSLLGEYLQLEDGMLNGLHWLRSNSLFEILHEGFPNPASTALAILNAVPSENIASFISNALCKDGLDTKRFISKLTEQAKGVDVKTILDYTNGFFEAGERIFFNKNRNVFDESYKTFGSNFPFLIGMEYMPVIKDYKLSSVFEDLAKDSQNFQELNEIIAKVIQVPRGLDLCKEFLSNVISSLRINTIRSAHSLLGQLLDWCALCELHLPSWNEIKDDLVQDETVFELPFEEFCNFTQGLYRYDASTYQFWFSLYQNQIIGYVKLHIDCITLEVSDQEAYIEFFPDSSDNSNTHEQTMNRINYLRSTIPFCENYKSQGIWLLPSELKLSFDETYKDISEHYLPFNSDVARNSIWFRIIDKNYLPDSYYTYQKEWFSVRLNLLTLAQKLSKALEIGFSSSKKASTSLISDISKLFESLEDEIRHVSSISAENLKVVGKTIPLQLERILKNNFHGKWLQSLYSFITDLSRWLKNKDESIGKFTIDHFKGALSQLDGMQNSFGQLFQESPDYFGASSLDNKEKIAYSKLADLLEVWILNPPHSLPIDVFAYIRANKESERQEIIRRVQETLAPLQENGLDLILPNNIYLEYPQSYLPIVFSVDDTCSIELYLEVIISEMTQIRDLVSFFCLIPIYKGKRFLEGSYQISSTDLENLLEGKIRWEMLIPLELPKGIWNCLQEIEFCQESRHLFRASIYGLMRDLEILTRRQKIVSSLKGSKNIFEIALYDRHISKTKDLALEFRNLIIQIKNQLENNFSAHKNSSSYLRIRDLLEVIEPGLTETNINDIFSLGLEETTGAVDNLLKEAQPD
ncbi:MAG: hypothetical protein MH252_15370 [Thermosynechococcaceae cyanobacterium MS004]|nr:hypothetical protein [Thermosynechococcaceae cyanobacterium MS004]